MKKIWSKFLGAALSAFLLISPVAASGAEEGDGRVNTAVAALSALDIMRGDEDGAFHPERQITRMEFVALVLRTLDLEDTASAVKNENMFQDVDISAWGAGAVNLAASMGLVAGYGDGRFGPDDPVTVNQAVKVMVCALGYQISAEAQGYPGGYLSVGNRLGILKGLAVGEQTASRGEIALLIYNSLEVPMLEDAKIGTGGAWKAEGDETLLSRMDISIVPATVTGIYGASVSGTELRENEIELSGTRYESKVSAAAFLGLGVRAWILDDGGGWPVVLHLQSRSSDSLVIEAENVDSSSTKEEIKYWEGDSQKTESLSEPLVVVYNGRPLSTAEKNDPAYLCPENGRLIVNTDDGDVDLVVVWDYESYVVTGVAEDKIYDLYGRSVTVGSGVNFTLLRDGESDAFRSLKSGEVLWVAASLDGSMVNCVAGGSTVEGYLEEITSDAHGRTAYLVDGEEYILAQCYLDALATGHSKAQNLSPGDYAKFMLDPGGHIAAAESADGQGKRAYGYLLDAQLESGVESAGVFRIMTESNRFENIKTAGGINIRFGRREGGTYKTTKAGASEIIAAVMGADKVKKQLIQYELDDSGCIKGFYLADQTANANAFSMDVKQQNMTYAGGVLNQKYFLPPDTPVFYVPNAGRYEEQFYVTTAEHYFADRTQHTVIVYDIENLHVGAVMAVPSTENIYAESTGLDVYISMTNSPVMLIEKSGAVLGEDGSTYFVISGYVGKKYTQVLVSDTISATSAAKADLRPGNVIQYETNDIVLEKALTSGYDKVMVVYRKIFDCNDAGQGSFQTWNYTNNPNVNASICASYGVISEYDLPYLTVTLDRNTSGGMEIGAEVPFVLSGGTAVLRYRKAGEKVELLRIEDLAVGQKVFIRQRYNNTREVIILE